MVRVFQGEREMAADNKMLGQFDLVGIPPAPRGQPQIEVTFDIDASGIVNVSAKDKASGKEQTIRIESSGGLDEAEIQQLVRDAQSHAGEDRKRRDFVDATNQADVAVYTIEKNLKDADGHIDADMKTSVEQAITETREAMQGEDAARVTDATARLVQAGTRIPAAGGGTAEGPSSDPEIVDVEFEDRSADDRRRRPAA